MDYEDSDRNWLPLAGAILLVLGLAGGGFYYLIYGAQPKKTQPSAAIPQEAPPVYQPPSFSAKEGIEESTTEILENLDVKIKARKPEDTAQQIAKILESGDLKRAAEALGGADVGITSELLQKLQLDAQDLEFQNIREVGELEINRRKRFALERKDGAAPLFLDLTRRADGQWEVNKVQLSLAPAPAESLDHDSEVENTSPPITSDSLTISDRFLQAALSQDFNQAKSYVNHRTVSDAKIAAMCILFEEGKYRLNPTKPLRSLFNRETTAGYLANVLTDDVEQPAQFGVNLARSSGQEEWKVTEINLDTLLADYAGRVAGGDVYYTPLVPNPQGGETLVIFFDFDEESLAPRTQRQLAIVADVLTTNANRKLTLSGHADALGSDSYNKALSRKRAASVRKFLIENGVNDTQIEIVAEGESRPRRPNETLSGDDNPDGRRANRRTEIYLDFGQR